MIVARGLFGLSLSLSLLSSSGLPLHAQSRTALQLPPSTAAAQENRRAAPTPGRLPKRATSTTPSNGPGHAPGAPAASAPTASPTTR